jgi:hypothetical protein
MEVPVKIIGNSKGVMAGGDLRLNTKLKVRALPKDLPDLLKLTLHHLIWVTNCTLLKCQHQTLKSCTQTTLLSVK